MQRNDLFTPFSALWQKGIGRIHAFKPTDVSNNYHELKPRTTERTPGVTSQAKIMYRPDFVPFRLNKIPVYVVPSRRV